MAFAKTNHQTSSSEEVPYSSESTEKTIPFLRRLVDMLHPQSENDNVISFCPGSTQNGQIKLGQIVVHDRIKVENEILPRYFNHSSFASLRRQLNYFSFTRIGKGRQKGATYCNEGVIEIEDILRLRRRSTTMSTVTGNVSSISGKIRQREDNTELPTTKKTTSSLQVESSMSNVLSKIKRTLSVPSSHSNAGDRQLVKKMHHVIFNGDKNNEMTLHIVAPLPRPKLVSPATSPVHSPSVSPHGAPNVSLDLTVPPSQFSSATSTTNSVINNVDIRHARQNRIYHEDPDVLAGCRALLCFSHGLHSLTV